MRSWDDAYAGNSAVVSVTLFAFASMLWLLSSLSIQAPKLFIPILIVLLIAFTANAIISTQYFFLGATLFQVAAAALVAVSIFQLRGQLDKG